MAAPIAAAGPMSPADARQKIRALEPLPWPSDRTLALQALDHLHLTPDMAGNTDVLWLSDGIAGADKDSASNLAEALQKLGRLSVVADPPTQLPLVAAGTGGRDQRPDPASGARSIRARRSMSTCARWMRPAGCSAWRASISPPSKTAVSHEVKLPTELRNRIATFSVDGATSAAGILLLDDRWRQRPVGLIAEADSDAAQPLLSDLFYVERALAPYAELRHGDTTTLLHRDLAVLIMADVGLLGEDEVARLKTWIDKGGVLHPFCRAEAGAECRPTCCRCACAAATASWAGPCHGPSRRAWPPSRPRVPSPVLRCRRRCW